MGLELRAIARGCSIGLGTSYEYLQRAEAAGVRWPLGGGLGRRPGKSLPVGIVSGLRVSRSERSVPPEPNNVLSYAR